MGWAVLQRGRQRSDAALHTGGWLWQDSGTDPCATGLSASWACPGRRASRPGGFLPLRSRAA
eukprot:5251783-Lingulodinium_polyedra.AAC.1